MTAIDITGGRVLDPGQGIDTAATVSVAGGVITGIGPAAGASRATGGLPDRQVIDAAGLLVLPGLVDLHTHVFPDVSHYGVEPDPYCLGRGVTTVADAGSAGAQTFPAFRKHIIERSGTRILAFLNIAVPGMVSPLVGELEDLRWASPEQTAACARENPGVVVGIKARLGYQVAGHDPGPALRLARAAADALGLPLMCHVTDIKPSLDWLLPQLAPGDIVTHCFHGHGGGVLDAAGRVLPTARRARARGVLFDVGHGAGSFSYQVARAALGQDFPPDTVSSDLHTYNTGGPAFDQPTTLSKLLHLGMPLAEVIRASTAAPAAAVGRGNSLGAIAAGREADLSILEIRDGSWPVPDTEGRTETLERMLVPRLVIRAGQVTALGEAGHVAAGAAGARQPGR